MRNSSHSPGCMRALPASQSCHVRRVEWMRSAAADCESPAASRAARIASGLGLDEGPFGPRFGWLGIDFFGDDFGGLAEAFDHVGFAFVAGHFGGEVAGFLSGSGFDEAEFAGVGGDVVGCHFLLQPLFPRRGVCDLLTIQIIHGFRAYASTFCGARSEPHND